MAAPATDAGPTHFIDGARVAIVAHRAVGLESVGGTGIVCAVAALRKITVAARGTADVGRLRIRRTRRARAIAPLGRIARTNCGAANRFRIAHAIGGARLVHARAPLVQIAGTRGRATNSLGRCDLVLRADRRGTGADLGRVTEPTGRSTDELLVTEPTRVRATRRDPIVRAEVTHLGALHEAIPALRRSLSIRHQGHLCCGTFAAGTGGEKSASREARERHGGVGSALKIRSNPATAPKAAVQRAVEEQTSQGDVCAVVRHRLTSDDEPVFLDQQRSAAVPPSKVQPKAPIVPERAVEIPVASEADNRKICPTRVRGRPGDQEQPLRQDRETMRAILPMVEVHPSHTVVPKAMVDPAVLPQRRHHEVAAIATSQEDPSPLRDTHRLKASSVSQDGNAGHSVDTKVGVQPTGRGEPREQNTSRRTGAGRARDQDRPVLQHDHRRRPRLCLIKGESQATTAPETRVRAAARIEAREEDPTGFLPSHRIACDHDRAFRPQRQGGGRLGGAEVDASHSQSAEPGIQLPPGKMTHDDRVAPSSAACRSSHENGSAGKSLHGESGFGPWPQVRPDQAVAPEAGVENSRSSVCDVAWCQAKKENRKEPAHVDALPHRQSVS